MILVNASISLKQIITINGEYELYLKTNKIPIVIIITEHLNEGLENLKYYGILKFYTSPKFN